MWLRINTLFYKGVSYLPLSFLYFINSILVLPVLIINWCGATSKRNLRRVFKGKTRHEIALMSYRYNRNRLDYLAEFLKGLYRFSNTEMKKRFVFENLEVLDRLFEKHRFVLAYSGHMINFEWMITLQLHRPDIGMCNLYLSGPKNEWSDWLDKARARYGAVNIPSKSPLRPLIQIDQEMKEGRSKYKGYVFGSLADMDPKGRDPHSAPFFNRKLEVVTGTERLGRRFDMGFVFAHITRPKRGYYHVVLHELQPDDIEENVYAYTDAFVQELEKNIADDPEIWFQWGEPRF